MNYISVPELAKMLGVSRIRAWQMLQEKKFKAVKVSYMWVVTETEAKRILKVQELKKIQNREKKEKQHENNLVPIN